MAYHQRVNQFKSRIDFDDPSTTKPPSLAKSAVLQALEEEERQQQSRGKDHLPRFTAPHPKIPVGWWASTAQVSSAAAASASWTGWFLDCFVQRWSARFAPAGSPSAAALSTCPAASKCPVSSAGPAAAESLFVTVYGFARFTPFAPDRGWWWP